MIVPSCSDMEKVSLPFPPTIEYRVFDGLNLSLSMATTWMTTYPIVAFSGTASAVYMLSENSGIWSLTEFKLILTTEKLLYSVSEICK